MKRRTLFDGLLWLSLAGFAQRQKTAFQTSNPCMPEIDFPSDLGRVIQYFVSWF